MITHKHAFKLDLSNFLIVSFQKICLSLAQMWNEIDDEEEEKERKLYKIYVEFMRSIHLFSHTLKFYCLEAHFLFVSSVCRVYFFFYVIYMFQVLIYVVCYACEFIFFSNLFLNSSERKYSSVWWIFVLFSVFFQM